MSKLHDYHALSFDVYGTLIDWESDVLAALEPLLQANNRHDFTRKQVLEVYHEFEVAQQKDTPNMPYSQLLTTIHPLIASRLGLDAPSTESSKAFGGSIGWGLLLPTPLVVLSNVDRESFSKSNEGPLQNFSIDLVITAQDVGFYKPNLFNFEYMLREVNSKFVIEKQQVLQTAESQDHDLHPARKMVIKSS